MIIKEKIDQLKKDRSKIDWSNEVKKKQKVDEEALELKKAIDAKTAEAKLIDETIALLEKAEKILEG